MSFVTGPRNGRSREAYPQSPGAGGALAAIVPLSRQRFIDGDTTQTGLNGAASSPFKTITQFMATRTNVSIADASANYVGWVMPAVAGYVENISFPPYVSTELRADSFSLVEGNMIVGNATWANVAGTNAAALGVVTMHNISLTGSMLITDDAQAPASAFVFSGDELGLTSVLLGSFQSNATSRLGAVTFLNAQINGAINAGSTITSAAVSVVNCNVAGAVEARAFQAFDSTISASAIIVEPTTNQAAFYTCRFTGGTILTALNGAVFDGSSWMSFVEAGSTRAAGTFVLVVGGYNGAPVEGAALIGANTSVSLNGLAAGTTAGFTGENSGNHYSTASSTPATVTLLTGGGEQVGDTILISRENLGTGTLEVLNGNGGTTIGKIPANERGFILSQWNGTNWIFTAGGSLAA